MYGLVILCVSKPTDTGGETINRYRSGFGTNTRVCVIGRLPPVASSLQLYGSRHTVLPLLLLQHRIIVGLGAAGLHGHRGLRLRCCRSSGRRRWLQPELVQQPAHLFEQRSARLQPNDRIGLRTDRGRVGDLQGSAWDICRTAHPMWLSTLPILTGLYPYWHLCPACATASTTGCSGRPSSALIAPTWHGARPQQSSEQGGGLSGVPNPRIVPWERASHHPW